MYKLSVVVTVNVQTQWVVYMTVNTNLVLYIDCHYTTLSLYIDSHYNTSVHDSQCTLLSVV